MAVVVAITLHWSYKKQVARWQTFRISISSDQVIRTQEGHEEVRVAASSISRMAKIPGRGLLIYAGRAQPAIIIPDTLERFDVCCDLIQRFRPIDIRARSLFPRWLAIPASLALGGVFVAFERSADLRVMIGLGILIAGVMALAGWRLYGSPDIDQRTKKRFIWIVLLVIAPYGMRMWSSWNAPNRMEEGIRGNRVLSLLVKARPELHDRLIEAMVVAERNKSEAANGGYVNPASSVLAEVLPDYLAVCSDAAITRYTKEIVTIIEKLEADPSDICYEWLNPHGRVVSVQNVLGKDGMNPLMEAMAGVVESGVTAPQAAPDAAEAEMLRTRAMKSVTSDELLGPIQLHPPEPPGTDKKVSCHKVMRTFRAFLDLPERESSVVLRHVLSTAMKK
jgi:hypothetical protein